MKAFQPASGAALMFVASAMSAGAVHAATSLTPEQAYQEQLRQEMLAVPGTYAAGSGGTSVCKDMSAGGVKISECIRTAVSFYDEATGNRVVRGGFGIVNESGSAINAFAVGTENTSPLMRFGQFVNGRIGWSATYISEANWDSTYGEGTFDASFGKVDTGAYVYSNRPQTLLPGTYFGEAIADGVTIVDPPDALNGNFYFLGPYGQTALHSSFVAWSTSLPTTSSGLSANVVASSAMTSAVPEPASLAMVASGLVLLIRRRRGEGHTDHAPHQASK